MNAHGVALVLALLCAAPAGAQTPSSTAPAGPAESGIRITRLATFRATVKRDGSVRPGVMQCVSFVDDAPREAKHVRFVFAYDDANGETVGADSFDRYGKFSTGALIEGGIKSMECISFKNVAPKPITSFQVHFAYHAVGGAVVEENTQIRAGDFAGGVENFGAVDDRSSATQFRNCWSYKALRDEPALVTITVPSVTFEG